MSTPPPDIRGVLSILLGGGVLDEPLAERLFELILTGHVNDAQLGAMLAFIAARGADAGEIVAGVRVLRRHMQPLPVEPALSRARSAGFEPVVLDTCGTGGGPKLFNVSTVAAFVVAGAAPGRVLVAKHGGTSRTGRGSAEVLQHLGVNVNAPAQTQARCLYEAGVSFSFAVQHHPAMRHAAAARKSLGFPTIFNLMGPLSNPAGATHQIVGTFDPVVARSLAEALRRLGTHRALVVTSHDGLDELTTTAPNDLLEVASGVIRESTLDASSLGLPAARVADLRVDSLEHAAQLLLAVLGGEPGAPRDMVELNAAASLTIAGVVHDLPAGLAAARVAIDAGHARSAFELMKRLSNEAG